ncbi:hypothetical protein CXX78_00570 [Candidatus Parvarchaeota archaeon]|jgi:hypothetical protein|nr:MAG: hypothetical protein CXX78_00570 [Candidatus Parvarchaeota archaeon]
MEKRGSVQLSFGMIFSIIIIIVTVSIAFYVIAYFLDLRKCTEIGLFYKDFQDKIDDIWKSEFASEEFVGRLPSGIDGVCLGNLVDGERTPEYDQIEKYTRLPNDNNFFFYPPEKTCDISEAKLNHVNFEDPYWKCFPVENGKVKIKLEKETFDPLVRIINE